MRNVNLLKKFKHSKSHRSIKMISEEVNIEEFFGAPASKVWQYLNDHGEANLNEIEGFTSLRTEEVCYALGWLGREGKLVAKKKEGRIIKFSLV
jgi:predicted transcriptional regulator